MNCKPTLSKCILLHVEYRQKNQIYIIYIHNNISEGPLAQTGAPYARVPGIRVYGMICLKKPFRRRGRVISGFDEKPRMKSQVPLPENWEDIAQTIANDD